eukprot:TRINITY_DN7242_c0_g1_i2.p3 TRINITY_DN7242_c0_g1~~TRINITY_DN7242_c0_g1_i2.p3  ORF type:complete len:59 (+),score=10.83 TRINITY_DN7242_c0_g1_i2:111-287(+)
MVVVSILLCLYEAAQATEVETVAAIAYAKHVVYLEMTTTFCSCNVSWQNRAKCQKVYF